MTNEAISFIRPAALTDQVPYAYAVTTSAERSIYTAGACPLDADGQTVAVGDYVGQARQVMANLVTTLREAGVELTDVVKSTVYVASSRREDLNAVWDVVHSTFGHHDAPSTLLGVSVLGWPDQLVEVEAIAVAAGPASTNWPRHLQQVSTYRSSRGVRDHCAVQDTSPGRRRLILGATFAVIGLGTFGGGLIAGLAGERWAWSPVTRGLVWGVISAATFVAWWLWIRRRL